MWGANPHRQMYRKDDGVEHNGFIYILSYEEAEDGDDVEELILHASTNIADILVVLPYDDSWRSKKIHVIKNNDDCVYDISLCDNASNYFKKFTPYCYNERIDKDEIEHVIECLSQWCEKRDSYLNEQKKVKKIEEEREFQLYKRLKRKFESVGE